MKVLRKLVFRWSLAVCAVMITANIVLHMTETTWITWTTDNRHVLAADVMPPCERHVDWETVHVIVMADEKNLLGLVTLTNSILQNTRSDVMFHFVTYPADVITLRNWIHGSVLRNISYEIIEFSEETLAGKYLVRSPRKDLASPLNFARVLLPHLLPCVGRVIFIDADCLVLDDIHELYKINIAKDHVVAGLRMCDCFEDQRMKSAKMAERVLNYSNPHVQQAAIPKDACAMNGGVFVADLEQWQRHNISQQLQHWMELNTRVPVIKYGDNGSGTQAILLTVLHDKYTAIPKEWNTITGLHQKLKSPKLIHWNGSAKPWFYPGTHHAEWMKYYVPDPDGRLKPRNGWRERKLGLNMLFVCLLLSLMCCSLLPQSEASWLSDTVNNVSSFARKHCQMGYGSGISVTCHFKRREALDKRTQDGIKSMCHLLDGDTAKENGLSMNLLGSIFKEVDSKDKNEDGVLNDEEYATFLDTLALYWACISKEAGN